MAFSESLANAQVVKIISAVVSFESAELGNLSPFRQKSSSQTIISEGIKFDTFDVVLSHRKEPNYACMRISSC